MALTIDYLTKIISVPQADLTLITGTLYELDTNQFKQDLADLQDDEEGIWADTIFTHNTEITVAGTTFARTIEIINGYSVEFTPDSQYSVRLAGSNNNIFDVENGILVQNQVQVIAQNSAGLVAVGGLSPTQQQIRDAMDITTTGGKSSVDDKLDSNFAIGAAGV